MSKRKNAEVIALDRSEQKKLSKETKKIKKAISEGKLSIKERNKVYKQKAEEKRGLIYIGHIPHGFYEDEIKDYFKQFGKVTNAKVCRSRKTGNSKGYGYVEFANPEVAKIAADTMNNYIMFKKRIVTEFVPFEKRPKCLFHGKSSTKEHTSVQSRRGKQKYTRNKILDDKTVVKKQRRSLKRVNAKIQKLQELGIQCNVKPTGIDTKLLEVKQVKSPNKTAAIQDDDDDDSDVEFRHPTPKIKRSKDIHLDQSKKSLKTPVSEKAILTKSLDTVKNILSRKNIGNTQNEETQTITLKKRQEVKKTKRGISKKEKKPVPLNKDTVKKIARELIRKKGNPMINILSNKPARISKKK